MNDDELNKSNDLIESQLAEELQRMLAEVQDAGASTNPATHQTIRWRLKRAPIGQHFSPGNATTLHELFDLATISPQKLCEFFPRQPVVHVSVLGSRNRRRTYDRDAP